MIDKLNNLVQTLHKITLNKQFSDNIDIKTIDIKTIDIDVFSNELKTKTASLITNTTIKAMDAYAELDAIYNSIALFRDLYDALTPLDFSHLENGDRTDLNA